MQSRAECSEVQISRSQVLLRISAQKMGFAGLYPGAVSVAPATGDRNLCRNSATKHGASFQVKCDGSSKSQSLKTVKFARREMALSLSTLCLTGAASSAEARIIKPEIRRKIMEKLKMLREKAGLSNQKEETERASPPPPSSKKGNNLPLEPPPLPLPSPPERSGKGSLVEATIAAD